MSDTELVLFPKAGKNMAGRILVPNLNANR